MHIVMTFRPTRVSLVGKGSALSVYQPMFNPFAYSWTKKKEGDYIKTYLNDFISYMILSSLEFDNMICIDNNCVTMNKKYPMYMDWIK